MTHMLHTITCINNHAQTAYCVVTLLSRDPFVSYITKGIGLCHAFIIYNIMYARICTVTIK